MVTPPIPGDETERLAALRRYRVLDSARDQALDDLTTLASHACETPIAGIAFVDEHREWFKSLVGWTATATAREISFSAHAIVEPGLFVVRDAARDARFADNPLVSGEPHIRCYAAAPLLVPDGLAIGVLAVIDRVARELSPRQLDALRTLGRQVVAQLELRNTDASRLAAIVESSDDAIIGKTLDGIITSWNGAAEKIFGYTADEVVGRPLTILIPDERVDEEMEILAAIRRGDRVRHLDTVRRTKDGRLVTLSITSSPIRDRAGRLVGASKVARDVTERRRADAALQQHEEQLRLFTEHSPLAVAMFDREMQYVIVSRRWMEDYGLGDRSIIGLSHYDIFPNLPERWRDAHRRCLAGAIERCDEDPFPRENGETGWIRWEARPWRRADGAIGGIIIFSEDLTDRKRAAEMLRMTEERMRFALESAEVGIWDMDYGTGVLRLSDTAQKHYGLVPGTFAGTIDAFLERVYPDDRPGLLETIAKAAKTGTDFTTEHRALWPDGTMRWLRSVGRVILDRAAASRTVASAFRSTSPPAARSRRSTNRPRRWRRSGGWPAASRTTSTTC